MDVCKEGIDGVVVCYESTKLNEHEKNYGSHDLDLPAVVQALKMWRNYLLRRKFVLISNHGGLRNRFDHPKVNARQARF